MATEAERYAHPTARCDLVMKGGIASGIVYPLAIARLAERYRFMNIGGTSAGAIAAAATAAAEYGRQNGGPVQAAHAFARLEHLPAELGASPPDTLSKLRSLFEPQRRTRRAFRPLAAAIDHPERRRRSFLAGLVQAYWPAALAGGLPGAALIATAAGAFGSTRPAESVPLGLLGLATVSAGAPATALAAWLYTARSAVEENQFGLCAGHPEDGETARHEHLTEWLHGLLHDLAFGDAGATSEPLTFGRLAEEGVRLRMVSSNLTLGRPYDLPFEAGEWWFKPTEFRRLFPSGVIDAMVAAGGCDPSAEHHRLPAAKDLPVIVATRMSLSFPLLLSAVPLYAPDPRAPGQFTKMWFSDGGICSNFPVHFFDAPLPRWPTFAINLRPIPGEPEVHDPAEVVWLPEEEKERDLENDTVTPWFAFGTSSAEEKLPGFLGAVANTVQNWHDSVQLEVPGYKDRVVHVGMYGKEGGLNLAMAPGTITDVAQRGERAAVKLADAFGAPGGDGYWDTHRWTRFRGYLAAIEDALAKLDRAYRNEDDDPAHDPPLPERPTYLELAARDPGAPPKTDFDWEPANREALEQRAELLVELARRWVEEAEPTLGRGGPKPPAQLRLLPRL